ncbi:MAG: kinase [Gammaproteobacteria bacterium]|nr:kinase [Gammaproteobacteria bacterium]
MSSLNAALAEFIEQEQLPETYRDTVEQWFIPLAEDILRRVAVNEGPFVLGINGCQGSGKSTLAALLVILFQEMTGIKSINLSLDDFYLTRAERKTLAEQVHPLLMTRGVPGTHDVPLAMDIIAALKSGEPVAIPRFDKATDERFAANLWPQIKAPVDVIIMEGWCLGVRAQKPHELQKPLNILEAEEDAEGLWRTYVNEKLEHEYRGFFGLLDMLVMLRAPGFERVIDWRLQQEEKLAARVENKNTKRIMSRDQLIRFISHYERLTRHALSTLPDQADVVLQLRQDQSIEAKLKG